MVNCLNISSSQEGLAGKLSNFTHWQEGFTCLGRRFYCMEALLQGIKFENAAMRNRVFEMKKGDAAKKMGSRHGHWQHRQILYLGETRVSRHDNEYQKFLDEAFTALYGVSGFQEALQDSWGWHLVHRIGEWDPKYTVLTEAEFCSRLEYLRAHKSLQGYTYR